MIAPLVYLNSSNKLKEQLTWMIGNTIKTKTKTKTKTKKQKQR